MQSAPVHLDLQQSEVTAVLGSMFEAPLLKSNIEAVYKTERLEVGQGGSREKHIDL